MTPFGRAGAARALAAIVAGAVLVRLAVVLSTDGNTYDLGNFEAMYDALRGVGLDAYAHTTRSQWPYPPGYFPALYLAGRLEGVLGFQEAVRLWPLLADVCVLWLVQDLVGRRGGSDRERLVAAAVLAFGPLSVAEAGWFGQLDPAATLPAVLAYWLWTRPGQRRRGVLAGLLIGVGAAIKTVPLLLVIPFAAAARTRREGAVVTLCAGAVLVLALLPFWLRTPQPVADIFGYTSIPGFGGISLLLHPSFSANIVGGGTVAEADLLIWLSEHGTAIVLGPALLALAALLLRREVDLLTAICMTWLTVYVFGVSFLISYLVWALPFFVIRGHARGVLALQLAVTPLTLMLTQGLQVSVAVAWVLYTGVMAGLWIFGASLLARWAVRAA